jgi:hypothetical protein
MRTAAAGKTQTGRKRLVRRAVLVVLIGIALVEPVLMYRSLQKQREQRRTATEQPAVNAASRPGAGG